MFFALSGKVKESARVLACGSEELVEMMARALECCCKEISCRGVERVQAGGVMGRYRGLRAWSEFCICKKVLGSHLASGVVEQQGFQPPHINKRRAGLPIRFSSADLFCHSIQSHSIHIIIVKVELQILVDH